jgi:hypothetical protein
MVNWTDIEMPLSSSSTGEIRTSCDFRACGWVTERAISKTSVILVVSLCHVKIPHCVAVIRNRECIKSARFLLTFHNRDMETWFLTGPGIWTQHLAYLVNASGEKLSRNSSCSLALVFCGLSDTVIVNFTGREK